MPRPKNPDSKLRMVAAKWLVLSRYEAAAGMDYAEWFKQLALRHLAFHTKNGRLQKNIWETIKKSPIADLTKYRPFLMYGNEARFGEQLKALTFKEKSGISRIELKDFIDVADALDPKRYLKSKQWREFLNGNKSMEIPHAFKDWPTRWYRAPVEESLSNKQPFNLLKIDPKLPKSVLKRHFEKFLEAYCAEPQQAGFTQPSISLWYKYGLLPLIDILLWEKLSGSAHTGKAKTEAIMPGDIEGAVGEAYSAYMKTVKPAASDILKADSKIMHKLYSAAVASD